MFLRDNSVAMVTVYVRKNDHNLLALIGDLFDTTLKNTNKNKRYYFTILIHDQADIASNSQDLVINWES